MARIRDMDLFIYDRLHRSWYSEFSLDKSLDGHNSRAVCRFLYMFLFIKGDDAFIFNDRPPESFMHTVKPKSLKLDNTYFSTSSSRLDGYIEPNMAELKALSKVLLDIELNSDAYLNVNQRDFVKSLSSIPYTYLERNI